MLITEKSLQENKIKTKELKILRIIMNKTRLMIIANKQLNVNKEIERQTFKLSEVTEVGISWSILKFCKQKENFRIYQNDIIQNNRSSDHNVWNQVKLKSKKNQ